MRWQATIHYRSLVGTIVEYQKLCELEDLQAIVERGPHWDTIEKIEINRINHVALTVEAAEAM